MKKEERLCTKATSSNFQDIPFVNKVYLPQLDIPLIIRTPTAVYDTRLMKKDINGVEYKYENKDELAFGTTYEGEDMN